MRRCFLEHWRRHASGFARRWVDSVFLLASNPGTRLRGGSICGAHELPEFSIDQRLDAPHRQKLKLRFGLARLGRFADLELPFPDVRNRRHGHRELDALVGHHSPSGPLVYDAAPFCCFSIPFPQKARLARKTTVASKSKQNNGLACMTSPCRGSDPAAAVLRCEGKGEEAGRHAR